MARWISHLFHLGPHGWGHFSNMVPRILSSEPNNILLLSKDLQLTQMRIRKYFPLHAFNSCELKSTLVDAPLRPLYAQAEHVHGSPPLNPPGGDKPAVKSPVKLVLQQDE